MTRVGVWATARRPEGPYTVPVDLGRWPGAHVVARPEDELPAGARRVSVYRWPRANAQHEIGHLQRIAEIDQRLAAHPGVFVTGSGFRGTGIPDCVADGRATGARASDFLE